MSVPSLVALSMAKMFRKPRGQTFLTEIAFMYSADLSPDRITVIQTTDGKYFLEFFSRSYPLPFVMQFSNMKRLLGVIVNLRAWRLKSVEFLSVAFIMDDVSFIAKAVENLGVELVLLRNCTYPGVQNGAQALRLFSSFNRENTIMCECGTELLRAMIKMTPPVVPPQAIIPPQVINPPQAINPRPNPTLPLHGGYNLRPRRRA